MSREAPMLEEYPSQCVILCDNESKNTSFLKYLNQITQFQFLSTIVFTSLNINLLCQDTGSGSRTLFFF